MDDETKSHGNVSDQIDIKYIFSCGTISYLPLSMPPKTQWPWRHCSRWYFGWNTLYFHRSLLQWNHYPMESLLTTAHIFICRNLQNPTLWHDWQHCQNRHHVWKPYAQVACRLISSRGKEQMPFRRKRSLPWSSYAFCSLCTLVALPYCHCRHVDSNQMWFQIWISLSKRMAITGQIDTQRVNLLVATSSATQTNMALLITLNQTHYAWKGVMLQVVSTKITFSGPALPVGPPTDKPLTSNCFPHLLDIGHYYPEAWWF